MPSLIRQSSSFATNRIALTTQGLSEEPSGLVTVNVGYTTSDENNDYWTSRFSLNSNPPITPDIVSASNLQSGALYMAGRSVSKANGLVEISATYHGALRSALSARNKRKALTTQTVDVKTESGQTLRATFRANVIEYVVAVAENSTYSVQTPALRDLFLGFTSLQLTGIGTLSLQFSSSIFSILQSLGILSVVKEESSEIYTPSIAVSTTRFSIATQSSS